MRIKTLLTAMGLGAGLMYFYDPRLGNRRRALVRDKANSVVTRIDDSVDVAMEDMRNRARGVLAEMSAKLTDQGAPDWILEERVRTNLGRLASHTSAVEVQADGGRIYLSGGGARIPGMARALSGRMNVETNLVNPFHRVPVAAGAAGELNLDEAAPMLLLPLGLALRKA